LLGWDLLVTALLAPCCWTILLIIISIITNNQGSQKVSN